MAGKQDIVSKVSEKHEWTKREVEDTLNIMLEFGSVALESGIPVQITDFGKFEPYERAARAGRNPQTGEDIHIPAKNAIRFKLGKGLKEAVRNSVN